jgi:SAM-dependent methyltransferase
MTEPVDDAHGSEFGTIAEWTADVVGDRDTSFLLSAACRGSGSPAALAWLAESLHLTHETAFLDLGAGLGGPSAWVAEHYGVHPVAVEPMLGACIGSARLFPHPALAATAAHLPFPDDSFDAAWTLGVLDTMADPLGCLVELRRILRRDGGLGLLAYVAHQPIPESQVPDGNRFQTLGSLADLLDRAGFAIIDKVTGPQLPDAPLDWQLRQERVHQDLADRYRRNPEWQIAATQEGKFARLLDDERLEVVLLNAVCT